MKQLMQQYVQSMGYGIVGLSIWAIWGWTVPAIAQSNPAPSQCAAVLGSTIDKIVQQPTLRTAYWGILVQPLKSPRPLYSKNADQLFLPASNAKLLTTAAALTVLTPQPPRQTPVFATGQAPALSTVRIVGQGDPSFSDRTLEQLALALKAKGVQSIGTLIGDDSLFQGRRLAPSWSWEDLQGGDGLPVNSLILNGNIISAKVSPQSIGQPLKLEWLAPTIPSSFGTVQNFSKTTDGSKPNLVEIDREEGRFLVQGQLRSGSSPETIEVPVPDPGPAFLEKFRAVLQTHQIKVNRLSVVGMASPQPGETLIASAPFPALAALAAETNQQSNNLYAETLLRLMGSTVSQPSEASTPEQGLRVLKQTLTRLGVDSNSYQLVDGSGLSRKNLVSPRALAETLRAIAQSPNRNAFRASLAVAGQSGTLRQRFLGTPIAGHFYGKTGTLQGISTLSGFLELPSSPPFVLSILVNHSTQSSATLRQAIEQIVTATAQASSCS
jgi:serine-type D-Ala-D-Ala carboxypeptidase/endopeptidase (penicillin-binding protein 4)